MENKISQKINSMQQPTNNEISQNKWAQMIPFSKCSALQVFAAVTIVDGLPPAESVLPGLRKIVFLDLFCYSFHVRLSRGPRRHP